MAVVLSAAQLSKILPLAGAKADAFAGPINEAGARFGFNQSKTTLASFIAQVGHESGQLLRMVENLNYSAQGLANTWPARFAIDPAASPRQPNSLAMRLARRPEAIANSVYGNRLGNIAPGDGWKFRGRGLIQLTGKTNYESCGKALKLDLVNEPDQLLLPGPATQAAGWFWDQRKLNAIAWDVEAVTRKINGGTNGLADRRELYERAMKVLA